MRKPSSSKVTSPKKPTGKPKVSVPQPEQPAPKAKADRIPTTSLYDVDTATHIRDALLSAYDTISERFESKSGIAGLRTGFADLDDILSGLTPGNLTLVASVPSMGKTAFCLNIAHHVAMKERLPVAIFSLEMSKDQIAQRLICSEAQVNSRDLRRGFLQDSDWHRVTNAVNNLYQVPIFIDDTPELSSLDIRNKSKIWSNDHNGLGLIVVDFLQLMKNLNKIEDRPHQIAEYVRELKVTARELNAPILLLTQISTAVMNRPDKRPSLRDLHYWSGIEAFADEVLFIHRPSFYTSKLFKKDGSVPAYPAAVDPDEGIAEIIIGKQRNGPTGTIRLGFQPEFVRFTNFQVNLYGGYD